MHRSKIDELAIFTVGLGGIIAAVVIWLSYASPLMFAPASGVGLIALVGRLKFKLRTQSKFWQPSPPVYS